MFDIDTAIQIFLAEGYNEDDVVTALDSFVGAGVDHEDEDGNLLLDDGDMQVVRNQLNAWSHTITTGDPYEVAYVTDWEGDEIDRIEFDFYSEDEAEWERLADATLADTGWRRLTDWRQDGNSLTAQVARA